MKAKIYIGAKKYALYIGRKIVEKTLEFLTLPARFVSKKVQELKNYTMYGQSVQNGTPTPQTPIEVESVGDRTKNLFDKDNIADGYRLTSYLNTSYGKVFSSGVSGDFVTAQGYYVSPLIEVEEGKTYIKNSPVVDAFHRYHIYNSNKICTRLSDTNEITIGANEKYISFCGLSTEINTTQFEEGTQSTPYEPYNKYKIPITIGNTTTNIYLSEPLRKIGGYADTMSVDGNEVTVVRNVVQINLSTVDGWQKYATYGTATRFNNNNIMLSNFEDRHYCKSNKYIKIQAGKANEEGFDFHGTVLYLILQSNQFTTVNELTAGLVDTYIVTPLSTPTTETYTIETPINLQQGTLTIDTDTKIKPSKIEITGDIDNE